MLREGGRGGVALTRSESDLHSLSETGCETILCDLADPDATREAAAAAQPVDLLVNNAGTPISTPSSTPPSRASTG